MAQTNEQIIAAIGRFIEQGTESELNARGMARAMIRSRGELPPDSPGFNPELSQELLTYAYGLLRLALQARASQIANASVSRAFELAAEALESVVKNGNPADPERGFHRIVAGAAYHLARYSARAYSVLNVALEGENISPSEEALAHLILRRIDPLLELITKKTTTPDVGDDAIIARLNNPEDPLDEDGALVIAITDNYLRAIAAFLFAVRSSQEAGLQMARARLVDGETMCSDLGFVPLWWIHRLTRFLLDELWNLSLHKVLPDPGTEPKWTELRKSFIGLLGSRSIAELELWPSQIKAAGRIFDVTDNLVVSLPTSAGKTRIAEMCILRALSLGQRVVFVTPLRALSAQTEHSLSEVFVEIGYEVSGLYGGAANSRLDLDSLKSQQIVVSTPEKLDFALRNDATILDDIGLVVVDEGHMLGPGEREVRYEVLIQRLLKRSDATKRRLVCLSAMLPDGEQLDDFVTWLRADNPGDVVKNGWRPTRLRFGEIVLNSRSARYALQIENQETFINRFVTVKRTVGPRGGVKRFPSSSTELALASAWKLVQDGHSVLIYCPVKKIANGIAAKTLESIQEGNLTALPVNADAIQKAVNVGREWLGPDHPVVRALAVGVAVHHASLPKVFLNEIDILIRKRYVKVVAASPTLAQGLNICASCVLFQAVSRFDMQKKKHLMISPQEFANVAGRAGRAFVDVDGQVLGIVTTPNSAKEWKEAKERASDRNLQSGIYLILSLLYKVLKKTYFPTAPNIKKGIEYILNHADLWETFAPKEKTDDWKYNLDTLDVAIISMCGEYDSNADELPAILDEVLKGSFMQRQLARETVEVQQAADTLLKSRAKFIWGKSTNAQRKGYFFAGVGLQTGLFLDTNAGQLNASLQAAENACAEGRHDDFVRSIKEVAEIVFQISPFAPRKPLANWKDILVAWINGAPATELIDLSEDAVSYLEDAIIYRLCWAVEAIRSRSRANDENIFDDKPSVILPMLSHGTLSLQAAILMQAGLPSRIAAFAALRSNPATFTDLRRMRAWLKSPAVLADSTLPNWPTPETSLSWKDFVAQQNKSNQAVWIQANHVVRPADTHVKLRAGDIAYAVPKTNDELSVFTPDMEHVGSIQLKIRKDFRGFIWGRMTEDMGIDLEFRGHVSK